MEFSTKTQRIIRLVMTINTVIAFTTMYILGDAIVSVIVTR